MEGVKDGRKREKERGRRRRMAKSEMKVRKEKWVIANFNLHYVPGHAPLISPPFPWPHGLYLPAFFGSILQPIPDSSGSSFISRKISPLYRMPRLLSLPRSCVCNHLPVPSAAAAATTTRLTSFRAVCPLSSCWPHHFLLLLKRPHEICPIKQ